MGRSALRVFALRVFALLVNGSLVCTGVATAQMHQAMHSGGPVLERSTRRAPEATQDLGDFYVYGKQRISLLRSLDRVGVRFSEPLPQRLASDTVQALVPSAEVELLGAEPTRGVSVVRTEKRQDGQKTRPRGLRGAAHILDAFRASAQVQFVYPVLVNPATGRRLLLTDEIVVKLKPSATAEAVASAHGLVVAEQLWGTQDEFVLRLGNPKKQDPLAVANAVSGGSLVVWAEPNFVQEWTHFSTPSDPRFTGQWHLDNTGQGGGTADADVDAPEGWDVTTGDAAITIAIIDDGAERTHEDLNGSMYVNAGEVAGDGIDNDSNGYVDDVSGWDFSNGDNDPSPMSSDDNHGTAVAGVAAATGDNGIGVTGACQSCRILPVKIFSPDFAGDTVAADAIRYAASKADVLSNSWGGGTASAAIQSAIQWARTNGRGGKGCPVFFASGNYAGGYLQFSLSGIPAGTHAIRWRYSKDSVYSDGEDTAWLGWVEFPGGERVNFESGNLPSGFSTSGNANWTVSADASRADSGWCLTRSAKAGTIGNSQYTDLVAVRTVPAGTLRYGAWTSSEYDWDFFEVWFDQNNDGTWTGPYLSYSGVPHITTAVSYPAAHPESIAVGAVTDFACRADYSEYGADLDLVAPSDGGSSSITTTDRTGSAGYDTTGNYTSTFGGTSSATPLAAGIAGLVLSRNPEQTVSEVTTALQDTADKVGPDPYVAGRNDRYGYGRVNAAAALGTVQLPCAPSLDPLTASYVPSGGNGSVSLTIRDGCAWTATSTDDWITVTSGFSGTASGSVGYSVAANPGVARTGAITIASLTFAIEQDGSCTAALSPTSAGFTTAAGTGTVGVTAVSGCTWTAVSGATWITVTSGVPGSGNGTVGYSVAANAGGPRAGTIEIAGQPFIVNQSGVVFNETDVPLLGLSSGGATWGDYDNDSDLDLLMTGCTMTAAGNGCYILHTLLYRNDGAGTFTSVSTGMTDVKGGDAAWGDYDNDGDIDLVLSGCSWATTFGCGSGGDITKLYRNDGAGAFTEMGAGLPARIFGSVEWGDYDRDGDLDLLLFGTGSAGSGNGHVYRNDGGTFVPVWSDPGGAAIYSLYATWGDYDNDGDLDFASLRYRWMVGSEALVYRNDGGTFNAWSSLLAQFSGDPSGLAWGDYDADGNLDLAIAGYGETRLYRNDGAGTLVDTGAPLATSSVSWRPPAWGDYDNDGRLDLLIDGRRLHRNLGAGTFIDSGEVLAQASSRAAWGDYDGDGDLDIVSTGSLTSALYRNDTPSANSAPGAPTGLSAAGGALSWLSSSDAQTPTAGLTYNLRVGTTPGSNDVAAPMASAATGYRRVVRRGGADLATSAILSFLPAGTYYWSVQAVDGAYAGSPFAPEATVTVCSATFNPTTTAVPSSGGAGDLFVSSTPGCAWVARSLAAWITVTSGTSGTGDGVVSYSVAANSGPAAHGNDPRRRSGLLCRPSRRVCLLHRSGERQRASGGRQRHAQRGRVPSRVPVDGFQQRHELAQPHSRPDRSRRWLCQLLRLPEPRRLAQRNDHHRRAVVHFDSRQVSISRHWSRATWPFRGRRRLGGLRQRWRPRHPASRAADASLNESSKIYRNDGGALHGHRREPAGRVRGRRGVGRLRQRRRPRHPAARGSTRLAADVARVYSQRRRGASRTSGAGLPGVAAGAAAWGDYDNDGDLDILSAGATTTVTATRDLPQRRRRGLHRHRRDARRRCSTRLGGLGRLRQRRRPRHPARRLHGGGTRLTRLYRNDGGRLHEAPARPCRASTARSVAWGDYDNDGDLDILLAGYPPA